MPVRIVDSSRDAVDRGLKFADKLLDKDVAKQRITAEDAAGARERLSVSTSIDELADVDFVIEAVPVCAHSDFLIELLTC